MKTNYVWVVEMLENGKWAPCAAAHLNRSDAADDLHRWLYDNPNDKFRVVKYVSAKPTGGKEATT